MHYNQCGYTLMTSGTAVGAQVRLDDVLEFLKENVQCTKENSMLVIMDNHKSHLSVQSLDFCKENGIIVLTLPLHISNRLQPLGHCGFGPFKRFFSSGVNSWIHSNLNVTLNVYALQPGTSFLIRTSCLLQCLIDPKCQTSTTACSTSSVAVAFSPECVRPLPQPWPMHDCYRHTWEEERWPGPNEYEIWRIGGFPFQFLAVTAMGLIKVVKTWNRELMLWWNFHRKNCCALHW